MTSDETPDATTVASRSSEYDAAGHTSNVTDTATVYLDPPQGTPPASSPETVEYYYDADDQLIGRRHQKSGVNVRAFFYFLGGSHLAEEAEPGSDGGSTKVTYLNAVDGKAVAEQRNSDWIWLLRDPKGSIATRVKSGGDVVSQQAYDPYGDKDVGGTTFSSDVERENPSSLGFQGSHTDANTGNLLIGPRIYDPTIDRFTTADYFVGSMSDMQLGTDALTSNRYLFAAANPVAYFEDGHSPTSESGGGKGGGGLLAWLASQILRAKPVIAPFAPFIHKTGEFGEKLLHAPEGLLRWFERSPRLEAAQRVLWEKTDMFPLRLPFDGVRALPTKDAARDALSKLNVTSDQLQAARRAISKGATNYRFDVGMSGENVLINASRPGYDGHMVMRYLIRPSGLKSVVQIGIDDFGRVTHYDPKT